MQQPLVSVVIPTYNHGHFVREAVDSVLAQTYSPLEVIVVDDGSKDDTRATLQPYGDRIRYIYQDNQGLSAARNTGIRAAKANLIALLDADDAWHPRKLEIQVQYLQEHPEIGLLGTGSTEVLPALWPELEPVGQTLLSGATAQPVTLAEVVIRTYFAPSSVLLRKECFDKVGLFDPALKAVEDRDMWIRIASYFRMAYLDLPLIFYRMHTSNMSSAPARMEENGLKVLRKAFDENERLRGRFLLRRKALGFTSYWAALLYRDVGRPSTSLARLIRSFFLWPLPYERREIGKSFVRLRLFLLTLARILRPTPSISPQR